MTTYFLDENLNGPIVRGLATTDIPYVRIQDTDMMEADDPVLLDYTAQKGYVLVSHDQATLPAYFWRYVADEQGDHPGMVIIPTKYRNKVGDIVRFLGQLRNETLENQIWWYTPTQRSATDDSESS